MHDSFRFSVTIAGLNELRAQGVSAPGRYTAKLMGWSDEEIAVGTFSWLADAIGWVQLALAEGALVKRANIFSKKNELVWTMPGAPRGQRRESAVKQNAQPMVIQVVDDCPIAPSELQARDNVGNAGVTVLHSPDHETSREERPLAAPALPGTRDPQSRLNASAADHSSVGIDAILV